MFVCDFCAQTSHFDSNSNHHPRDETFSGVIYLLLNKFASAIECYAKVVSDYTWL